jgi:hypothetical protein
MNMERTKLSPEEAVASLTPEEQEQIRSAFDAHQGKRIGLAELGGVLHKVSLNMLDSKYSSF